MGIPLRTEEELVKLREACKLASDVLVMIDLMKRRGYHRVNWIVFVTIIW